MLSRRPKRRYLSILHIGNATDAVDTIVKRCSDLFGSVATENAALRLVKSENGITIIKCKVEELDRVLASIALSDPPVVTLDMSGSIKRLERRLSRS